MAEALVSLDEVSKAFFIPTTRRTTIREHAFGMFERDTVERLQVLDRVRLMLVDSSSADM